MARFASITWFAAVILLAGTTIRGTASIAITPELQQLREEDRIRQVQLDAEMSLHEKIQVGKQRYQEREAFRAALIEGLRVRAEEKRDEMSGQGPARPTDKKKFDPTNLVLTVACCSPVSTLSGISKDASQKISSLPSLFLIKHLLRPSKPPRKKP